MDIDEAAVRIIQDLVTTVHSLEPWMADAACRHTPAESGVDWFADRTGASDAQAVCDSCPVCDQCLDYATSRGIAYGVWSKSARARTRTKPTRDVEEG
jgi:hypothetical protein